MRDNVKARRKAKRNARVNISGEQDWEGFFGFRCKKDGGLNEWLP